MPTPTVENYIKQIYLEQQPLHGGSGEALVPMGRLAAAMGVVPGTATTMVKALSDSGLVAYEPRGGVRLTRGGEQLALHVLRRHRLVELFLVKVLERMDQVLGRPSVDPHGDPIPSAKGKVDESRHGSLADCELNRPCRIARVLDQDPAFLQFVDRCGLMPGVHVTVEVRDALADAVWVRPKDRRPLTLGTAAAAKILVENA